MRTGPASWSPGAQPLTADDPQAVGAYRLLGKLGEGGMGSVYLGLSDAGRKVAVKVIRRELAGGASFRARFSTEVSNAQRVASFCTAAVLEHGEVDGVPYLVTEYIDGPSLSDYIKLHGPFPADRLRSLAVGVATALTAIHAVRLVHRDLKPGNVLLSPTGPRVIDFGIARALDATEHHMQTGGVVGSPGWVAPEQLFDGQVGTAVDIFAWGTLIAYAGLGRHPCGTGTLPALAARAQQGRIDLTGVPPELLPAVTAAVSPDPARRPGAEALLQHLVGSHDPQNAATAIIGREWTSAAPPTRTHPPPTGTDGPPTRADGPLRRDVEAGKRSRTLLWSTIAGASTALIVGGATLAAMNLGDDPQKNTGGRVQPTTSATSPSPAAFTRISDPCGTLSRATAAEHVPNSTPVPSGNVADGIFGSSGVGTGCTWTSSKQPGSQVQKVRTLTIELVVSPEANGGATRTSQDLARGRSNLQSRANTTIADGTSYGPLTPLSGVGDEAFTATSAGKDDGGHAFSSAVTGIRFRNVLIEIRYGGGDYPTADEKPDVDLTPMPANQVRAATENMARELVRRLTDCPRCYNE